MSSVRQQRKLKLKIAKEGDTADAMLKYSERVFLILNWSFGDNQTSSLDQAGLECNDVATVALQLQK